MTKGCAQQCTVTTSGVDTEQIAQLYLHYARMHACPQHTHYNSTHKTVVLDTEGIDTMTANTHDKVLRQEESTRVVAHYSDIRKNGAELFQNLSTEQSDHVYLLALQN